MSEMCFTFILSPKMNVAKIVAPQIVARLQIAAHSLSVSKVDFVFNVLQRSGS